jgi:hypothetical protein
MTDASNAMRRHGSQMASAIQLGQTDLSEEERREIAASVAESFREAQSAWDAYREHLVQHGLIPAK